jgi:hypothetical protein
MRLALMTVGFAGLFAVVNAVPGAATPVFPQGSFVGELLGHGTLSHGSLAVKPGLEIVVTKNTVKPGGTSGWHSHPGGAIVVIQSGQITTYRSAGRDESEDGNHDGNHDGTNDGNHDGTNDGNSRCIITTYMAGQSFIERPGEPLNAKNNGLKDTIIYATFPGVPVDASGHTLQRTDEPNPGTCPI